MGKDMREVHDVVTGSQFAYGVAGGISVGNKRDGTSLDETAEERGGTSVCGRRGMDPCSDIHPDQVLRRDRVLGSGREPADGWNYSRDSEDGSTCPCASCGLDQTWNRNFVGRGH